MNTYKKLILKEVDPSPRKLSGFETAAIVVNRIKDVTNGSVINLSFDETLVEASKFREDNPLRELNDYKDTLLEKDDKYYIAEDSTYKLILRELNNNKCPYLIMRVLMEDEENVHAVLINPNDMIKEIL
jgi:hypothetical protein